LGGIERLWSNRVSFLIDVHHIGARETGNETWARNISRELVALAPPEGLVFAACQAGQSAVSTLTGADPSLVSASAIRRLTLDLPQIARRSRASALLVQYTKPLTRRPCVVMVHDLSAFDPRSKEWLSPKFRARVRASIIHSARSAAAIVVPSEFTKRGLIERFSLDPADVAIAANAVDPELADLLAQSTGRPNRGDQQRVIAVGNVVPRKNLSTLAAAIAKLRANGSAVELRIVGTVAASGRQVEQELRRRLGEAVSFTGYVSTERLAAEYAAADLLAFPSLFEGFGIPAIEAMQAGVPVLVSDSGSLPEVVAGAGIVLPPTDIDAWTVGIGEVLGNADRSAELSRLGRQRAQSLSWTASATTVLHSLRRAAGQ
jgi:glycosyltransferase involved in cell wall biosynthesis